MFKASRLYGLGFRVSHQGHKIFKSFVCLHKGYLGFAYIRVAWEVRPGALRFRVWEVMPRVTPRRNVQSVKVAGFRV